MPLKYTITKDEHEALDEAQRGLYRDLGDGRFRLDVEGTPDVSEFRNTNRQLLKEKEELDRRLGALEAELTTLRQTYDGIDPTEARRTIEEVRKRGGKPDAKLDDAIASEVAPLRQLVEQLQQTVETSKREAEQARQREISLRRRAKIDALAAEHKVRDSRLIRDAVASAAEEAYDYDPEADALVPKRRTDDGLPLTPERWFASLRQSDPTLFGETRGPSIGDGDKIQQRGDKRILLNPTPEEMGQHAEAIAAGQIAVVRE